MPNINVPTIPNYPPQGIQAQLDLVYLWNPDVANGLIDQINKALEDLDKDLSMYLTKAEAAATYATQTEVTQLSGALGEVSNKVDTVDNDLKELGEQTANIEQDVNTLKTDITGKVSKSGDTFDTGATVVLPGTLQLVNETDPDQHWNITAEDATALQFVGSAFGYGISVNMHAITPVKTTSMDLGGSGHSFDIAYIHGINNGADITVPTVGGTLTLNEVNFKTAVTDINKGLTEADAYTKEEVDAKVSSVYRFRGSVATYNDLPTEGNVQGDVWNVEDTGANYAWTGTTWDKLSETVDLTPYLTKEDAADTYATITTVNGKQDQLAPNQLAAVNSGITSEKVAAYDAYAGEITAVETTANKADSAAEVAQQTANLVGQNLQAVTAKIPTTASSSNLLVDTETMNTALAGKANSADVYTKSDVDSKLGGKVNIAQGADNAGKVMTVGEDGNLAPADAPSSSLPDQTGNAGKFLTTDGTNASWGGENILINSLPTSLGIETNDTNVFIGYAPNSVGGHDQSVFVGAASYATTGGGRIRSTAVGYGAMAGSQNSIAIGYSAGVSSSCPYAIQLGPGSNSLANTFSVGLSEENNYTLLQADGIIPTERLAVGGNTGDVLTRTATGVEWSSSAITTDTTLTGAGTPESPLGISSTVMGELETLNSTVNSLDGDVTGLGNQVTEIQSSVNTLNTNINNKADKATDFETPITETNKGATMKEIEEVQTTSIKFKGYISTTQPASDAYLLVDGNMWINAATMPPSFPVPASSIRVWSGSAWQTTTESYTPDALDAWSNLNNNEGYYWFGAWKVFSTDLSTEYFTLNQTSGLWEIKQSIHLPGTPTVDTPDGTNPQAIVNVDYVNTMGTIDNKITNCVLQIPQNINLELNNGTLTLKAGSKTYIPRSGGGFDELVTTKDITYSHPIDGEYLLFIESQGRWVTIMQTVYCFSGTTEPEKTGYKVWYDTGTNIINYYNADNVASKQSFPIAKITVSGGQISSIDAVFNGFGFIGSSVFSFPGLKVAVPNGRNPDGTLNTTTTEQTRVITTILPNPPRTKLWANAIGLIAVNDETMSVYGYTYDERLNIVYSKSNMQRRNYAHIADLTLNPDDNLQIIDINPKYPIRVTDYWDFNKLVKEVDNVAKEVDNVAKLDAPNNFTSTNNSFASQILIRQENGFAPVNIGYNSIGTQFSIHSVLGSGWGASVGVDANGTYCSTPAPDSDGDNIANTEWVRDLIASKAKIEDGIFIENLGTNIVRISGIESFGALAQQDTAEHPITLPVTLANANYVVQTTATSANGMCEIVSGFSARTTTGFNISVRNLATAAEATDVAVCWSIIGQKV